MAEVPGIAEDPDTDHGQGAEFVVAICGGANPEPALAHILQRVRSDSGAAFVVLREPDAAPFGASAFPVAPAHDGAVLRAGHVYVCETVTPVQVDGTVLRMWRGAPEPSRGPPVDRFLESLARSRGANALAVLLSGGGKHGADGLLSVRRAGGATFAQAEADADAAVRRALEVGAVERVLSNRALAEAVEETLAQLADRHFRRLSQDWEERHAAELHRICRAVHGATGHDVSLYKKSTFARRLERRLQATHTRALSAYADLVEREPAEAYSLLRDLHVSVTQFFRDPDAFAVLRSLVFPELFARAAERGWLRLWVPACATGEEAYSLAMLVREYQRCHEHAAAVQIFATDIDDRAIDVARQGKYPVLAAGDVSKEYLYRYFRVEQDGYQVRPELRDLCVFSRHSVLKDPPFSRIDFISCRNLLIYWEPELQRRVIPTFHYALNPHGVLFLGPAENIGSTSEYFTPINKKHRLFRRLNTLRRPQYSHPPRPGPATESGTEPRHVMHSFGDKDIGRAVFAALLKHHAPPAVVFNERGDVLFFSGQTGRYFEPPFGSPSNNVFDLIKKALRPELHALAHRAMKSGQEVCHPGITFESDGLVQQLHLIVRPLSEADIGPGVYMAIFQELAPARPRDEAASTGIVLNGTEAVVQQLEAELRDTREHLQNTIEEVKSSNEELLSTNEELQSANEELQTSKEELQSTNEELQTVNAELSRKVEELDHAHSDLLNFFQSTQVPILFLDRGFNIQKFTPSATRVFSLVPTDIGRPISDIKSQLEADDFQADFARVLESLQPLEREVRLKDESAVFIMRVGPYRTVTNVISGVVVSFADVTELKRAQENQARLAAIVDSTADAIVGRDLNGLVTSWNASAEQLYWYAAREVLGRPESVIVPPDRAGELELLLERVRGGESVSGFETERLRKDGKRLDVSLTISPIRGARGRVSGFSIISRDITQRKRGEMALGRLAAIVESSDDAIISKDLNGIITSWNAGAERLFGYTAQEMIGRPVTDLVPPDQPEDVMRILGIIRHGRKIEHFETVRVRKDGTRVPVSLTVSAIHDAAGNVIGASKIARDISRQKAVELERERGIRLRDDFISIASHELRTPLTSIKLQMDIMRLGMARNDPAVYSPERMARLVAITDRQVDRLTAIVNNMLDISRIAVGKLQLERTHMRLAEVVHEVSTSLSEHIAAAGCRYTEELDPDADGHWDRGRIEQVLTNLLTNACRYARGASIRLRVRRQGTDAVLEVSDDGPGIAPEDQARIFERFERASEGQEGGFGMGLYIVREIVRAHGGAVSVESEPGRGATFRVSLPAR